MSTWGGMKAGQVQTDQEIEDMLSSADDALDKEKFMEDYTRSINMEVDKYAGWGNDRWRGQENRTVSLEPGDWTPEQLKALQDLAFVISIVALPELAGYRTLQRGLQIAAAFSYGWGRLDDN